MAEETSSVPAGVVGPPAQPNPLPPDLWGWNWGAFFMNWLWGIANNTWLSLLVFVPLVGAIMPFILGAKGNEWAWHNRQWESIEQFKKVQKAWAVWGWSLFALFVALPTLIITITLLRP